LISLSKHKGGKVVSWLKEKSRWVKEENGRLCGIWERRLFETDNPSIEGNIDLTPAQIDEISFNL
jgi:hypothetical protein